jgi:hypothetical protein
LYILRRFEDVTECMMVYEKNTVAELSKVAGYTAERPSLTALKRGVKLNVIADYRVPGPER